MNGQEGATTDKKVTWMPTARTSRVPGLGQALAICSSSQPQPTNSPTRITKLFLGKQ